MLFSDSSIRPLLFSSSPWLSNFQGSLTRNSVLMSILFSSLLHEVRMLIENKLIARIFSTVVFIWVDFNSPEGFKYQAPTFEKLRPQPLFSLAFSTLFWTIVSQYNGCGST